MKKNAKEWLDKIIKAESGKENIKIIRLNWKVEKKKNKIEKEKSENGSDGSEVSLDLGESEDEVEILELEGDLIIENFYHLIFLVLEDAWWLDKLVVKNCPKLKEVYLRNSGIRELKFDSILEKLLILDFGWKENKIYKDRPLYEVDLNNTPNLKILILNRRFETKIKGIENLVNLRSVSFHLNPLFKTFKNRKEAIKKILGLNSEDLPDNWKYELENKLGKSNLADIPSNENLESLINYFNEKSSKNELNETKYKDIEDKLLTTNKILETKVKNLKAELNEKSIDKDEVIEKIKKLTVSNKRFKMEKESLISKINKLKKNSIDKKILIKESEKFFQKWEISSSFYNKSIDNFKALKIEKIKNNLIDKKFLDLNKERNFNQYLIYCFVFFSITCFLGLNWLNAKLLRLKAKFKSKNLA